MPELPDIALYVEHLRARIESHRLETVRLRNAFLLRTVDPPLRQAFGKKVLTVGRLGKRVFVELEEDLYLVVHLMIAGRLHWKSKGAPLAGRASLAAFDFDAGTLLLTEAGTKRRASLHVVRGHEALQSLGAGGLEVLDSTREAFAAALTRENHTLKRAMTDPSILSGIGNAYSDEILHQARLSPVKMTQRLTEAEIEALHRATKEVISAWIGRLRAEHRERFPERVTAFHAQMAVHGKYGQPCPVCGAPVQRIVHGDHETNYCAPCQTGGKLLADRALSRLLRGDWPRTLEDLEERRGGPAAAPPLPKPRSAHRRSTFKT